MKLRDIDTLLTWGPLLVALLIVTFTGPGTATTGAVLGYFLALEVATLFPEGRGPFTSLVHRIDFWVLRVMTGLWITVLVMQVVPAWAAAVFGAWLVPHFLFRNAERRAWRWLRRRLAALWRSLGGPKSEPGLGG